MPAVSDSSPLILFAKIGGLDLLRRLFDLVHVPPEVWAEVVVRGTDRPGGVTVGTANWIRRTALTDPRLADHLAERVGRGEAEAIALAHQMPRDTRIILDDAKGRSIARSRGLSVVGSAGVLALAKEAGIVAAVSPLLIDLRTAGLFLDDRTTHELLTIAGESSP